MSAKAATVHTLPKSPQKVSQKKPEKPVHPESLLNLPLLKHVLADPCTTIYLRAIDHGWYQKHLTPSTVGFNPLTENIFIAAKSPVSRWLQDPYSSARWYNENDLLMQSVGFLIHDYLHIWSYRAINALYPEADFGMGKITRENIEDYVFCHLLTETAAVVGLDYWYLSTIKFNEVVPIGSSFTNVAVSYREDQVEEYRRWNADFEVQTRDFFGKLAEFYCHGGPFMGVWITGMERNPLTHRWLQHEMTYGEKQRLYTRQWLARFAEDPIEYSPQELTAPVDTSAPWKKELIHSLGEVLWEKVKENKFEVFGSSRLDQERIWRTPEGRELDLRFTNVNHVPREELLQIAQGRNSTENFNYWLYQYVSSFDLDTVDMELTKLLPTMKEKKDIRLVEYLFQRQKKVAQAGPEPKDLFFLN